MARLRPGLDDKVFVLIDDARPAEQACARLYVDPIEIVACAELGQVKPRLQQLREAQRQGLHVAGYMSYEAGYAFEPRLVPLCPRADGTMPLLWFGIFEDVQLMPAAGVPDLLPDPQSAIAAAPLPRVGRDSYQQMVGQVQSHIAAGDIYQANLTFPAAVPTSGSPLALYAALRRRAQAGHGGIVFTGEHWMLSFSPELFFEMRGRSIRTRPMKGTAKRGSDAAEDAELVRCLRTDPKQRAENLMIVDLLRNDLSRVSRPGSVQVPSLFTVESYPTVHQMTSTVTAELREDVGAVDVLEAMFPCGSITGAPKIRAMEIIARLEETPRGVYTGTIGWMAPGGEAAFNVAIRTLTMRNGDGVARLGLGSGIVSDSRAPDEWSECLAKGAFVADGRSFDLVETMRFDPHEGILEIERHLARMKRSGEELGFLFDRHEARNEMQAATFHLREERKVRLALSKSGAIAIEVRPLPPKAVEPVQVTLAARPVEASDFRLRHKTTDRPFYDRAREEGGAFETLFHDEEGYLTEGSFTNIFVKTGGRLVTPPLSRGLLPGILREQLIAEGEAEEGDLTCDDLAGGFFIGNSLRGLMRAVLV